MIRINPQLSIPTREIEWAFSRSSGPGGQNVNKVETKATLKFNVAGSTILSDQQRMTLMSRLRSRLTDEGVLQISSSTSRSQAGNKEDALERFVSILQEALRPRRARKKTRPTAGSVERRREIKRKRSEKKEIRRKGPGSED